ncbi:class I SAM-dependent methyltransferase [Catenuloplanes atrovinosus]|uniref:SAM-dependent methyltransferase n=1 Tax=Catenuloplanes atrovinosus TaxID=137266 RepID=A0AAE3YSX2_9ACTN|nr:class I SAM-dependent methyltransferase [Catenuloplanes atrovinosus]MDR7278647.1 SAM-dependent methyltransferase [Catenuloplanes atrovinosus]
MRGADIRSSAAVEERHWWYRERRALLARELRRLRNDPPQRQAIEIGAAGGGNCLVMRDFGYRVLATEQLPEGVEIARARGLDAIRADARDLPVESGGHDLLVAFDVLEHIAEDDLAAAEIHRVLRPGGTALIAVPADMRLWSSFDDLSGHVRRYDRAGLRALIEGAGLRVDALWSWNVLLRPAVALRRTATARPSETALRHDVTAVPPLLNTLLGAVVRLERHLPTGGLPGVSLFLRAHKPF